MQSLRRISARLLAIVSSRRSPRRLGSSSSGRHLEVGVRGRLPCDDRQREQGRWYPRSIPTRAAGAHSAGAKRLARITEKLNQVLSTPSRIDSTEKLVEMLEQARGSSISADRSRPISTWASPASRPDDDQRTDEATDHQRPTQRRDAFLEPDARHQRGNHRRQHHDGRELGHRQHGPNGTHEWRSQLPQLTAASVQLMLGLFVVLKDRWRRAARHLHDNAAGRFLERMLPAHPPSVCATPLPVIRWQ
jgi:hypothetical protein